MIEKMDVKKYTEADLMACLSAMGLNGSETFMVHSSMKSIGQVDGGADTVLDALSKFFSSGLLVLPAFTYASVNAHKNPYFYSADTPTCTGILTELFRRRPGVKRSLHPNHSLAALGRDAAEFCAGHEKSKSSFSKVSPFWKLVERKGKVLLIGVNLNRATIIHAIQEWADLPILSKEPQIFTVTDVDGTAYEVRNHYHLGCQWEFFPRALPILLEKNAVKQVKFGDADSLLMDIEQTTEILDAILRKDPHFFYNSECPEAIQMP